MAPYHNARPYQQNLFSMSNIDDDDPVGERLEKNYGTLIRLQSDVSEKEGKERIAQHACKGPDEFAEIMEALLYAILTDPGPAEKIHEEMTRISMLNEQAFGPVLKASMALAQEKFTKLNENARKQWLWVLRTLTKNKMSGLVPLYVPLLRNLPAGDFWKNVPWIEAVIDVISQNKSYLDNPNHIYIIHMAVMSMLQLIQLHNTNLSFSVIKDKEIDFVLDLLRNRFKECFLLGRELVRNLYLICKLPKIRDFWADLLNNPKSFANGPDFTGIPKLMETRTPTWLYSHKLSSELEDKVAFLLSKVRGASQSRYLDIFFKQYLSSGPESDLIIPEIIRFVCRGIHPTNEVLGSDILQRWNFLLFLLTVCKTQSALSSCLLSLFYDWLVFEAVPGAKSPDHNVMNIEPAILVMMNAWMRNVKVLQKPLIVVLVDYLCRIPFEYLPQWKERARLSVVSAFKCVLEKKVVTSVAPIYEAVPEDLKMSLRKSFPEIFDPTGAFAEIDGRASTPVCAVPIENGNGMTVESPLKRDEAENEDFPVVPDEEMEPVVPARQLPQTNHQVETIVRNGSVSGSSAAVVTKGSLLVRSKQMRDVEFSETLESLSETLRGPLTAIKTGTVEEQKQAMHELIEITINQGQQREVEDCDLIGKALSIGLSPMYDDFKLPNPATRQTRREQLQSPLFIFYKKFLDEWDATRRERIVSILAEMEPYLPYMGGLLLYYLSFMYEDDWTHEEGNDVMKDFEDWCEGVFQRYRPDEELDETGYRDLIAQCIERVGQLDSKLVVHFLPVLYQECPGVTRDDPVVTQAVVTYTDAKDVHDLCCVIIQKRIVMFSERGCDDVLKQSIRWESMEQTYFWRLFEAHGYKAEYWPKIILSEVVNLKDNPEAVNPVVNALRDQPPREDHVRELLRREPDPEDMTLITLFIGWTRTTFNKNALANGSLAEIVGRLLNRASPVDKKKRVNTKAGGRPELTPEQIVGHLDVLRKFVGMADSITGGKKMPTAGLVNVLYDEHVQNALRISKAAMQPLPEKVLEIFNALLLDSGEDETEKQRLQKKKRPRAGAKAGGKKEKVEDKDKDSDSSESSEEETSTKKAAKVR